MTESCALAWQAEALEDSRLSSEDAAAFRRHLASCDVCSRELAALAALRQGCLALPVLESSPLERRRLRNRLLQRANALSLRDTERAWLRPLVAGFALALCFAVVVLLQRPSPEAGRQAERVTAPSFRLVSSHDAVVHTVEHGATLRLSTERGHLEIAVDKLRTGQRFVLMLPDGELTVQGTRFVVDVQAGHTERVAVSEGRVALRLHGRALRVLNAGDVWSNEARAALWTSRTSEDGASATVDASSPSAAAGATAERAQARPGAIVRSRAEPRASARAGSPGQENGEARAAPFAPQGVSEIAGDAGSAQAQESLAGPAFAAAVAAFSAGDYGRSEQLFARFEQLHAGDARVEDALFLRAVAFARRGNQEASRALARSYLQRYPAGLRREAAERLAR